VLSLSDKEEKLTTFAEFGHKETDTVSLPSLMELDDIRVV